MVSREQALREVWGGGRLPTANTVDRYVAYLRAKLGPPQVIHTVRGVGFAAAPMRNWKLRTRVALAAALAIFLAVALVGVAIQLLLARDLRPPARLDPARSGPPTWRRSAPPRPRC